MMKRVSLVSRFFIFLAVIFLVFSCIERTNIKNENKGCVKKLREIEFSKKMMDTLSEDLRLYKKEFLSIFKDKLFVIVPYNNGRIVQFNIYASEFIIYEYNYKGFLLCEGFLLVLADIDVKLNFYNYKSNFQKLPCEKLINYKKEHEHYTIRYLFKDNSFYRWTPDYEKKSGKHLQI